MKMNSVSYRYMALKQNVILTVLSKNHLSLPAKTQKAADRN